MNKIARISWKDMLVIFRDRAALILMLGGPLLLTIGMGLVTGAFARDENDAFLVVPVLMVNQDEGPLGVRLVSVLESPDLAGLIELTAANEPVAARQQVEAGEYAAAIVVPREFTASLTSAESAAAAAPIQIYADPTRTISGGIVRSIVTEFVRQVEIAQATAAVSLEQLASSGDLPPEQLAAIQAQIIASLGAESLDASASGTAAPISISKESLRVGGEVEFNPLAYFAPAMALLFLMYTVTIGARSFLAERQQKTLARMLVAPVKTSQILGGKVLGIFLSGVVQVGLLVALSAVLFNLRWGSPLGVLILIMAAAAAATGWGLLVASIASTPAQVSSIGTTLMLSFGILGGSFVPLNQTGPVLQALSKLTPNAWALDGFYDLATGAGIAALAVPVAALLGMAIVLFAIAAFIFRQRQTSMASA